jgi:hypothetical protein
VASQAASGFLVNSWALLEKGVVLLGMMVDLPCIFALPLHGTVRFLPVAVYNGSVTGHLLRQLITAARWRGGLNWIIQVPFAAGFLVAAVTGEFEQDCLALTGTASLADFRQEV